jgi:polyisoprenoid-binding protein YceI
MRLIRAMAGVLLASASAEASDWRIDPAHSQVGFTVRHMMIANVHGAFGKVQGNIHEDAQDIRRSTVAVAIDVPSVDTLEPKRDAHLRSPDFFDAAKFPTMTFHSTQVSSAGAGKLALSGELSLHGVTRPISMEVTWPAQTARDPVTGARRRAGSARCTLNRKDYGLLWNRSMESGGMLVGDEVQVSIDLELVEVDPNGVTAQTGASTPAR